MDMLLPSLAGQLGASFADQYTFLSCSRDNWGNSATQKEIFKQVIAADGILKNLRINLFTAPGLGASRTFTVQVNGVDTALSCTVIGTGTTASNTSAGVALVAGDLVALHTTFTGTPTDTNVRAVTTFSSVTDYGILTTAYSQPFSTSSTEYVTLCAGSGNSPDSAIANSNGVVPTAGTISNLYARVRVAPGGVASRTFTLMLNGAPTTLTCTITGAGTTANDATHSVAVVAGDLVAWKSEVSGSPASSNGTLGAKWTPTVAGESIWMLNTPLTPSAGLTVYHWCHGVGGDWDIDETVNQYLLSATTVKKLYAQVTTAPGGGKSRTYTARIASANTAVTCTIADAATTANDTTHSATATDGQLIAVSTVPSGSPTGAGINQVSMVLATASPVACINLRGYIAREQNASDESCNAYGGVTNFTLCNRIPAGIYVIDMPVTDLNNAGPGDNIRLRINRAREDPLNVSTDPCSLVKTQIEYDVT